MVAFTSSSASSTLPNIDIFDVARFYISRGDNVINDKGRKADKFFGIELKDGRIYWVNKSVDGVETMFNYLRMIFTEQSTAAAQGKAIQLVHGFKMRPRTSSPVCWLFENNQNLGAYIPITKIAKHHDEVFTFGNKYYANAVRWYKDNHDESGNIWFNIPNG